MIRRWLTAFAVAALFAAIARADGGPDAGADAASQDSHVTTGGGCQCGLVGRR